MARKHYLVGGAVLVAAAVVAACTKSTEIKTTNPADPLFSNYVALGNSITAGYQSGGINDSTQKQSYAVLFAAQAGTRFAIPNLAMPGCAPPVNNFLTQSRVTPAGYPTSTAGSCYLRTKTGVTPIVNNVAVPGAATIDPTSATTANSNALTTFILGGATQDQRASQASPTFVSIWIGNNDVLAAALSGMLVATAPYSPGVTPQSAFVTNYKNMINGLTSNASLKGGVLFAVVDVTNAPLLFHSSLLQVPAVLAAFEQASGQLPGTLVVDPSCNNPIPLISFQMASYISAGTLPPIVMCKKVPLQPLFGDLFVLDSVEVPAVQAAILGYNTYIKAKADSLGWAYVDVNPMLAALKAAGYIPPFPNLASATQTFGPYFTLDGVHPSALSHDSIANKMIDSVNAHYGTSVPKIQ